MVRQQLGRRGIRDPELTRAMRCVPREKFVPPELAEFAYDDSPLPIAASQTISQPYIVALMTEALDLTAEDRVLEIGTGSGYAAAVLSELADEVYTVERVRGLADAARDRLAALGYTNVQVRCGDGTQGWPEEAPFDAIAVTAGGPEVPASLLAQLAPGGRLVMPVGADSGVQRLKRITRESGNEYTETDLGAVRFVPLIGAEGWEDEAAERPARRFARAKPLPAAAAAIARLAEPFDGIAAAQVHPLLARSAGARVLLLGEATHGTAEFYEMRARITRELVTAGNVRIIAVEADWPDARQVDRFVRGETANPHPERSFARFPTWMWANAQVLELVRWLREWNAEQRSRGLPQTGFYGLDLYSLYSSIRAVLDYLDGVDPEAAAVARSRYGCLAPWTSDPAAYGAAALRGGFETCANKVVQILQDLLSKELSYRGAGGERFFDAQRNAALVKNAERYYRAMYHGSRESWNLRDSHMFETLSALMGREPGARAVVWAHNSHLGDAAATSMSARGETNVGELCRRRFGSGSYSVGFGTDHGTVAAADTWDGPMRVMSVRPAHADSYERLCHDSRLPRFLLPLRGDDAAAALAAERLERAIGVIYRPDTELASHYFHASLPRQFDEWIWFDSSRAVDALPVADRHDETPETFPFGL